MNQTLLTHIKDEVLTNFIENWQPNECSGIYENRFVIGSIIIRYIIRFLLPDSVEPTFVVTGIGIEFEDIDFYEVVPFLECMDLIDKINIVANDFKIPLVLFPEPNFGDLLGKPGKTFYIFENSYLKNLVN